ncbi:hypothetical protein [Siansivirga zeaxanthinifaciens]|uniref:Membrane or secreted protein n=1 Tax=Siansivirga zeaxanthinifaciens CC-SAMT-1 TaxID=1454006 RepID=A0A0C5VVP7_9FLAO|nr:hypothetical protein [Siansivirga zeaxanthinifaciens]AJR03181.1 hypothetical protein AW14_05500 [Siansivirga zeaxanthinifaciens CC-SAMT-1]
MDYKKAGRYLVLGILFFLPVMFLLLLYPATHNYTPLDIVNESVLELDGFKSNKETPVQLKDHITILGFLGKTPMNHVIAASNLKELVYDKFKGFKKFQIVIVVENGTDAEVEKLKSEINKYEDIRFWHFVYGNTNQIENLYNSLKFKTPLKADLSTNSIFIIDKDLYQRGRLDDREDNEIETNTPVYKLYAYDCIEVAEIKNKLSDDLRILFTEYRQKRKGEFDSSTRRADDLKNNNEKE